MCSMDRIKKAQSLEFILQHMQLCSTVQLTHSGCDNRKDISVLHLIIIIKSEVPTFPIVDALPWLCDWGGWTTIFCQLLYTYFGKDSLDLYLSGKAGFVLSLKPCNLSFEQITGFIITVESNWCRRITSPHYHHHADFIKSIEHKNVCYGVNSIDCILRWVLFSPLSSIHYTGLCNISWPISFQMSMKICVSHLLTLSYHKPLFRVRSRNNGMRWMSYYNINMAFRLIIHICGLRCSW